ncbi:MAG: phosphoserine phosphatase SerB [Alphaproteobacteria bacterium]|nr:phosphoserine phosphatase SerB [Alphaproteobacteria bacterium]
MAQEFPFVLNVIGADAVPDAFAAALPAKRGAFITLSPQRAFDWPFDGDPAETLGTARTIAAAHNWDVNVVAAANRRKQLLIADMDSTIITVECLDEIADMMGLKPQVAAITERAMRGEIAFEPALRERVALLKGLAVHRLSRVYAERVRLTPGAKPLVATMKANGATTLLVSGGFTFFTQRVAADAGFDDHQANVLLDDGTRLLGTVEEPILGREAKLRALNGAIAENHLDPACTLAVGDGANDLAMIERAGLGVAFHAKPVVAEAAAARIDHNHLDALLYLQGYSEPEIVRT